MRCLAGCLWLLVIGCTWSNPITLDSSVPDRTRVPKTLNRLAVLTPSTPPPILIDAYLRLEGGAFELTDVRPSVQIIERRHLQAVREELAQQQSGMTSEETAVRVGRLLGVDGILLFEVQCCVSLAEWVPSRYQPALTAQVVESLGPAPVMIVSKLIEVETGAILYHDVVTARLDASHWGYRNAALRRQAVLDAVDRTIADLRAAFR